MDFGLTEEQQMIVDTTRAKAFIPRRSDPAPGSVIAWQSCFSPRTQGRR